MQTCGDCGKVYDESEYASCPDCHGDEDSCQGICPESEGSGTVYCDICDGEGEVDSKICYKCDGDGGMDCPDCDGTGEI